MADGDTAETSPPEGWPDSPYPILALNRMGSFEWDLAAGRFHMDARAHEIFDLRPEEFDGTPESLSPRVPVEEGTRLDEAVNRAIKEGDENYGAYFRVRRRDGSLHWTHTQGYIRRDENGHAHRVFGIVRDATQELRESEARLDQAVEDEARRRQTDVVQTLTAALSAARTVRDVFRVLGEAHQRTPLGVSLVVLGMVEGDRVVLVTEEPQDAVPGTRITRVDEPYPMSEVVRTLRPRYIESPREFAVGYPLLWEQLAHLHVTSAAYLPLIAEGKAVGAAGLLYSGRRGFTPQDRALLGALAGSLAQSLQRAMLYEQQMDLAQGLQQAMLPRTIPSVPGADIAVRYRSPAAGREIGGDWYDLIPLPGGRVGAVIGDVQGHDTHAAAVMGQLRIVLRAYATEGHTPGTVMARASVFLHELDTDRFATCLYAEVDPTSGVVKMVRAGHLDPILRGGDGACRRIPVEGGLPLGLSAEFGALTYPVTTFELSTHQTLVLCTDGLVELPGDDLSVGVQELMDYISQGPDDVRGLADALIERADRRGGDDDVALLLLRRRGPGGQRTGGQLRQQVVPGDPDALADTRHMIRAAVRAWGTVERADEIELAADELITNALMHTEGCATVTLRVLLGPRRLLRIEVEDTSSALPHRRDPGPVGMSGRGLMLVDLLADSWGVEARGGGKCVWCEFDMTSPDTRGGPDGG
ncbi:SpoIIE family protein phosphatase [Streptomyces chilikensis]|uniref:SpoIIE family protein phosphatase n=1 Tax=Streptomyces chilikensis TaxID=1194079 RepID=UPI00140D8F34|nr:SpoIIE family protein phosphatase [Streptomyces chilikensis]